MVKKLLIGCYMGLLVAGTGALLQAQLEVVSQDSTLRLRPHGYGHFRTGQIVSGTGLSLRNGSYNVKGIYTEEAYGSVSMEVAYKEHFIMHVGVDVKMYFSYPQEKDFNITKQAREDVILSPTYASFPYEKLALGDFNFSVGYFDFKYNPDVRNLGEFMFRSATYPAYIITYMDYPMAKLLGAHLRHELLKKSLKQDIMFTTETSFYPAQDWSLSYLLSYNFKNIFETGAGVSLGHLISVYGNDYDASMGSLTNPEVQGPAGNQFVDENGDTAYYTFSGNKVMGRISFDPKVFIPGADNIFGKSDLKIYGEAILIGTASYPDTTLTGAMQPSYSRWQEKLPVTFGFNLPTYKILDILNAEFEWWGSKYYNDYRDVYIQNSLPNAPALIPEITESKWKWSVYAKRTFCDGHFDLVAQAARDHMRLPSARYEKANHREMLVEAGNWWWCLKTTFLF